MRHALNTLNLVFLQPEGMGLELKPHTVHPLLSRAQVFSTPAANEKCRQKLHDGEAAATPAWASPARWQEPRALRAVCPHGRIKTEGR